MFPLPWKGQYFFSFCTGSSSSLRGFTLREAEWTKPHINTSVAKLAFVSEGSLSGDLTQQNANVLL